MDANASCTQRAFLYSREVVASSRSSARRFFLRLFEGRASILQHQRRCLNQRDLLICLLPDDNGKTLGVCRVTAAPRRAIGSAAAALSERCAISPSASFLMLFAATAAASRRPPQSNFPDSPTAGEKEVPCRRHLLLLLLLMLLLLLLLPRLLALPGPCPRQVS